MSQPSEAGFRIINILILESNFKREVVIDFHQPFDNKLDFSSGSQRSEDGKYVVEVKVMLSGMHETQPVFTMEVRMVGTFEKFGNPSISDDQFVNVNAPAIIFPFIREHIANLALKGGIGIILLPPMNFVK